MSSNPPGASGATSTSALRTQQQTAMLPDQKIDMFSLRGFELAQRIAKMYATSDAVPAPFRSHNMKKVGREEHWVENTSALGNCLVAIETAQAVGMSITAVMQNANIIEGKLSWSAQFMIAAVNASRRFTPLRFQMVNRGMMKAKYKEKVGWDDRARKPIMEERTVDIENIECTAWALPAGTAFPPNVVTLDQAKAAGIAVIEGAPVSMAMAVEEGWYSKAGSKWQTSMRTLMLQYRAGAFFSRIHAPDVVMGMGRTSEEAEELIDLNEPPAAPAPQTTADLRQRSTAATEAETVVVREQAQPVTEVAESAPEQAEPVAEQGENASTESDSAAAVDTAPAAATDAAPAAQQPSAAREKLNDALALARTKANDEAAKAALAGTEQTAEPQRRAGRRSSGSMSES